MEFLKVTQTRFETGNIDSCGLKPALEEENFQQGFVSWKGIYLHKFIVSVMGLLIYVLIVTTAGGAIFFSFGILL